MHIIERDFLQQGSCPHCLGLHPNILADLHTQLTTQATVKTHFFHGRYENIYISADNIRGLNTLLDFLRQQAAATLELKPQELKMGFWFNIMQEGDITTLHSHDDHDELLSGTYYLQMPENSGQLCIHFENALTRIEPVTGQYVLFHPAVAHEVTTHQSTTPRISLGFNFGVITDE